MSLIFNAHVAKLQKFYGDDFLNDLNLELQLLNIDWEINFFTISMTDVYCILKINFQIYKNDKNDKTPFIIPKFLYNHKSLKSYNTYNNQNGIILSVELYG